MADETSTTVKMMRPNDLCTAAFFGDVEKLKELLALEAVEEEPPIEAEFDPLAPQDEDAIAAAADRQSRRDANAKELQKRLTTCRTIVTRLSVVNTKEYGMFLTATESSAADGSFVLQSRYKTSGRSRIGAPPLHWAVLGREASAIEYLVSQGADPEQPIEELGGVTAWDIVATNELVETGKVLQKALAAYQLKKAKEAEARESRAAVLRQRDEMRAKAQEDIRRKEEEERLEAERQAAAEAAAANGGPGDGGAE